MRSILCAMFFKEHEKMIEMEFSLLLLRSSCEIFESHLNTHKEVWLILQSMRQIFRIAVRCGLNVQARIQV